MHGANMKTSFQFLPNVIIFVRMPVGDQRK